MDNKIRHPGIVKAINKNSIKVSIVQTSACASCKVSGKCNISEQKIKYVDIYNANPQKYNIGDCVIVVISEKTAIKAVMTAFGVPLAILLIIIFFVFALTNNELLAALLSLAALIPYYTTLFLMKNKLREDLSFRIE